MTRTISQKILAGLLAGSMIAPLAGILAVPAFAQSDDGIEYQSPRKQIAAGTMIKVKLLQDLNSTSAQTGDKVRVEVAGDDSSGLPAGTIFNGRVASVKPGTPKAAGVLRVRFGGSGSSSPHSTNSTASVLLTGTKPTQDHSNYASIGAGAGALLGFVRKRKLGDAIGGAVLGGAAGYGANQLTKKSASDVSLKRGSEISIKLDKPLTLRTQISNPY